MKIISKTLKLLPLFLMVLGLVACSDDDNGNTTLPIAEATTVVDIALDNDLNILAQALEAADLVGALQGAGPFTVFGPTDAAFVALLDSNPEWNELGDIPVDVLTNVLLNHVIIGSTITSTDLVAVGEGYANTMAAGPNDTNLSLYYNTTDGVIINGGAEVTDADNEATNGIVHIVDEIILPPSIATFATSNPALSNLVSALALADTGAPTVPWISTVSDGDAGPFTVFAPTNGAFEDLLMELDPSGMTALADLDPALVDTVLTLHVVGANVQSTGLSTGNVTTIGGPIAVDASNLTITDANGRVSNIVVSLVDIQGTNGVVHVIDKVILPELEMSNNIIDVAVENGFDILAQALTLVSEQTENDLLSLLMDEEFSFTVFAPSDDAFAALLDSNDSWNALTDIPLDVLTNVLLNHVIVGSELAAEDLIGLGSGYTNTAAIGPGETNLSLYFNVVDGTVLLNGGSDTTVGANVTQANVMADNGIIHVIDQILLPPTIADFAVANAALGNLVSALQLADTGTPTVPWINTVSDAAAGPFTVFAPTNDAFADLLLELDPSGQTALGDLDPATVDAVLTVHVVAANVQSTGLPNGTVTTLGGDITADNSAFTLTDANGRESNIITSLVDIQGANGVVHVIDKVILPQQ